MADLGQEIDAAVSAGLAFGPAGDDDPTQEVPADVIRDVLLRRPGDESDPGQLWLRNIRIVGLLDLEACTIRPRLKFEHCSIESCNLTQATITNLHCTDCEIAGPLLATQLTVHWNLLLEHLHAPGGIALGGAKVGGQVSLHDATLGSEGFGGNVSLFADGIEVAGDMVCAKLKASDEIRLLEAKIGGQFSLSGAVLAPSEGQEPGIRALGADRIEVDGSVFCNGLSAVGEVRLLSARIGGPLSLRGAKLTGVKGDDGVTKSLNADRLEVSGSMFCDEMTASGEVRMLGGKAGNQISFVDAKLTGVKGDDGVTKSLNADRLEVSGSMFCDKMTASGEVRLIGARIDSQFSLEEAEVEAVENGDGAVTAVTAERAGMAGGMFCDGLKTRGGLRLLHARVGGQCALRGAVLNGGRGEDGEIEALVADGAHIDGDMFCDGLIATGELRLLEATVSGQLTLNNSTLSGAKVEGIVHAAFNAEQADIKGGMFCMDLEVNGSMQMQGARVGAQLSLFKARLNGGDKGRTALSLVRATLDELILACASITGVVDLRYASARSLWDAEDGEFQGQPPAELRLEGFSYQSLREPLDAGQRLKWVEPSQANRYYPGVYAELSGAFWRIGHSRDAREIAIAGERRAAREFPWWHPRRLLSGLLGIAIGYGYRNWRALGWLVALVVFGSVVFMMCESSFAPARCGSGLLACKPPDFEAVLYAIDVTVPVIDIGQQGAWTATGLLPWVSLILTISGYALVTAVVAAAAGLLNRDRR